MAPLPTPPGAPAPLPADALRWSCDPKVFQGGDTAAIPPLAETMGQERALEALRIGLELYAPGFNVYVAGLTGTGRSSTVKRILEHIQPACALASDRCYVHNFAQPSEPRLLTLPRGTARFFRDEMADLVNYLRRTIPRIFEDERFKADRDAIVEKYAREEKTHLRELQGRVQKEGFALVQIQVGPFSQPEVVPVWEGQPVTSDQLEEHVRSGALPTAKAEELRSGQRRLHEDLERHLTRARDLAHHMAQEIEDLGRRAATLAIEGPLRDLGKKYPHEGVEDYLREVREAVLGGLERFQHGEDEDGRRRRRRVTDDLTEFQVNVVLDHYSKPSCPVIVESAPTYTNLFGTLERVPDVRGRVPLDHMKIRGGSLLESDGGYLVMNALDVFSEPGVWVTLKRSLKTGELRIQPPEALTLLGPPALRPQPIPLNVKVVLIGDQRLYQRGSVVGEAFRKIFEVLAEFDAVVDRTAARLRQFAQVASKICREEKLGAVEASGLASLAEFAVRRAGRQGKLSVRFSDVADVLREADHWRRHGAPAGGDGKISAAHVERAIEARRRRHGLPEEKLREWIREGVILLDVEGERVGQVNGLAVLDYGFHSFGKPSRITATVSPGRSGIINIEREARLSGETHDKGVLILAGFLRERYAQDIPLALTASLAFEQSYSGVDGDSASSTEIYALLSALSGIPLRQSLAVTGSVNQKGDIQAIGGVNEKIEGFYDVCLLKGLTGRQGVLVPQANVADLMLRPDVVRSVKEGKFQVWSVRSVDEGIALLTGAAAGERRPDGTFPPDSVNGRVQAKLREMAMKVKEFGPAGV